MEQRLSINGLILAGGHSSRMGKDKGLIDYHGKPQREYLFDLLTPYCATVYTSCKKDSNIPPNLNPLVDAYTIESPLNGILTAFTFNPTCAWLTLPVDMPYINEQSVQYLLAHRTPGVQATCFYDSDHQDPDPLFTLWEPAAYEDLKKFHAGGNISTRYFLKQARTTLLTAPDKKMLTNINSPDQLNNFEKL